MICSRLYGAIRQCDQIEPCCKASWEWVWWSWRRWGCPFSVCSKHWYPDLHRVLEGWWHGHSSCGLTEYLLGDFEGHLLFLNLLLASEQDGESEAWCAAVLRAQEVPFWRAGLQQTSSFHPKVLGGQGWKPGDEWHEVTHAPNPKHLTLENWLQF